MTDYEKEILLEKEREKNESELGVIIIATIVAGIIFLIFNG